MDRIEEIDHNRSNTERSSDDNSKLKLEQFRTFFILCFIIAWTSLNFKLNSLNFTSEKTVNKATHFQAYMEITEEQTHYNR